MKSALFLMLSLAVAAHAQAPAKSRASVEVRAAGSSPVNEAPAANFTGTARVSSSFQASPPAREGGALVSFEPGAHTAWHKHPLGQTLIVTEGIGLVQQEGQPAQIIRPGDVVTIPPNVRHWHGAGPNGPMTHLAVAERENGKSVDWFEKVSEAAYLAAATSSGLLAPSRAAESSSSSTTSEISLAMTTSSAADMLSAKRKSIPSIAASMAASDMPRLAASLNRGLDAGLTVSEAKEILVQLYAYVGFPKSLNALGELLKVVQARKARGIEDAPGREPDRVIPTGPELIAVGTANQSKISGGPVRNAVTDFAPLINHYLQAHLFGDIFERDNLDWQSRELATVGALAATPGVEAQLRSHMAASMRVGISAAQLRQVIQVLAEQGHDAASERAGAALNQALAATQGN